MSGPCLCGDPACGRCFPLGQLSMRCVGCGWTGPCHECEAGDLPDPCLGGGAGDLLVPAGPVDTCPECGSEAYYDDRDTLNDGPQENTAPLASCSYCGSIFEDDDQHLDSWWPYCSQRCALDAESESGEDA